MEGEKNNLGRVFWFSIILPTLHPHISKDLRGEIKNIKSVNSKHIWMPGRDTCSITPVGFQWKRWWRIYTVLNLCRNTLKDKFSHYYEDALWSSYFLNKKKNLLVHHVISFIQIVPGSADSQTISWSVVCLVSLFFLLLVLNSDEQPSKGFLAIVKEMRKIEPVPKKNIDQ